MMKDLTEGNPFKLILFFSIPVFIGCVFQQLYSMVDTIIVGNTVNAAAFTGVGLTGAITFLVLGFVNGLTAGFSVRVAQRYGAHDGEGVRRAVAATYVLCIALTVVITAIAMPLAAPLLRLLNTPAEYFDYAYAYLLTVFGGIGALTLYNMAAGILRAVGDSRTPLYFLILASVLNIGLDFAFIVGCKMHYYGAGLATVLSQLLSGGACLIYMLKRYPELRVTKRDFALDWKLIFGHISVGLPMALQFSITAVGCMVQQTAINGLNEGYPGAVTAFTAASKIDAFAALSFASLGTALATYTGQNMGAGRIDRVKQGVRVGIVYTLVCAVVGFAFCTLLASPLMRLFINSEKNTDAVFGFDDVLGYGKQFLLIQSSFYLFLGAIHLYRNVLQGMGRSAITMVAGVLELGGRFLTAFVFVKLWEFTGMCFTNAAAWVAAALFLIVVYYVIIRHAGQERQKHRRWRRKRVHGSAA
ncbi:MAG: MATE family efflux transporter [Clostridiales bacterium]|nr:MATE family efflux transporter [Clostridiales bacterium]